MDPQRDRRFPEGVTPDVKRNGIEIIGLPENNTFVAGETYTLTVSKFNLTSLGFKQNLFVVGWIGQMELGAEQVDLATPNEVQFTFTLSENGIAETWRDRTGAPSSAGCPQRRFRLVLHRRWQGGAWSHVLQDGFGVEAR
ncbi:hypothetical protein ACFPRL_33370 [Pseudoclavibacter helvolus]